MDTTDITKYITKYITKALKVDDENKEKNNLGNYKTYLKFKMINKKRYFCSRGLHRPWKAKLKMEQSEATNIANYLIEKAINRNGEKQVYFKEYYNEHRGSIQILSVELNKKETKELKDYLKTRYKYDIEIHSREKKIHWQKLKDLRKKQVEEMILYNIEKYYLYELSRYQKITGIKVS